MEDGDGGDLTPFWVQSATNGRRADRIRRRVSAAFFSSGLLVFILLVTAVFFLVFVVPSSLSLSAQIFKPNSVKKSWDSLNIILVLVAVLFGFLSRNKNEDKYNSYYDEFQASPTKQNQSHKPSTSTSTPTSNPSTPNKWYNYEGPKSNLSNSTQWYEYSDYETKLEHKNPILARNSNSYPDLRQISTTHWSYGDYYQRKYYEDDIHVDSVRAWNPDLAPDPGQVKLHRRHRSLEGVDHLRALPLTKTVIVDTLLSKSKEGGNLETVSPPYIGESSATGSERSSTKLNKDFEPLDPVTEQKLPQPPPAAVDSPEFTENLELAYERVRRKKERSSRKRNKEKEPKDPETTPPLAEAPPPSPPQQKSTHRKRSGATGSSTKDFLNSLYHKKKKKQRQKSVDNLDPFLHEAQAPLSFQIPPPSHPPPPPPAPPPPPPPPPSVFQNLFSSKKHKRKRTITVTLAPQSPSPHLPPPPPAREQEPTSHTAPTTTHNPPKPIKMTSFDRLEETSNSGGDSPLNRIPPPPPPPPPAFFKGPAWKFVVQGDYVRVNSTSSRSGSPDTDDGESDVTPSAVDARVAASFHPSPLFCPSPDVDTKAESFITNFRAKLKLEKIHSMRKKDVGLSGLGPGPGPSQFSQRN